MCFAQDDCASAPFEAECGIALKDAGGGKVFPNGWPFVCVPVPTCSDGIKNQLETDRDCGGDVNQGGCEPCEIGYYCMQNEDCISGNCNGGICKP
jgi:hypothetical protein